jgi:Glycosyl transferase family group 2
MSIKAAISTYELQGGTANIFVNDGMYGIEILGLELTALDGMQLIPEEEASKRQDFYDEHNIGWVARPKHNPRPKKADAEFDESTVFTRKGKFKKASNMNYALMVSNRVEEKLANISRHPGWTKDNENEVYTYCFKEVLEELNGRAWAAGNIRVGDYILIIDSDTRVPKDCLLDVASEMEQSPEVAIIQFSSGVMNMTNSFFEVSRVFPESHGHLACNLSEKRR